MGNKLAIEVELQTKSFEKQIKSIEFELEVLEEELEAIKKDDPYENQVQDIKDYERKIETLTNKLGTLRKKQNEIDTQGYRNVKDQLINIGSSTENVIKKVAKWGLAIFSIRSAYMMVRQAVSSLSQYDKQIGADIQYIRFALATALKPIIETIINLVYKLLAYIGYIAKAWFGVNLFANASAKAFQKVNSGVKDTNKSAKQLQKTLAGFDEMNILQDNGNVSSGGGGGGGVSLPSQDLSDLSKVEIPHWLEVLGENGKTIIDIIKGIGLAFATWEITKLVFGMSGISTSLPAIVTALTKMSGLQVFGLVTGVAVTIAGLYKTIKSIVEWINNPSWETFKGVLDGLALALGGVAIALIAVNASNPLGWIIGGIALGTELVRIFYDLVGVGKEEAKVTKSVQEAEEDLAKAKAELSTVTGQYKNALEAEKRARKELSKAEKNSKETGKELFDMVLTGQLTYEKMNKTQKKTYEAYVNLISATEAKTEAQNKMNGVIDDNIKKEQQLSASVYASEQTYKGYFKTLLDEFNKEKIGAKDMVFQTLTVMGDMDEATRKVFAENLPENVKKAFTKVREEAVGAEDMLWQFKDGTKMSLKEIEKIGKNTTDSLSNNLKSMTTKFSKDLPNSIQKSIDKISKLSSAVNNLAKTGAVTIATSVKSITGKGNAKGAIYYPPKLAVGGIINQPGRGVPLAMGGERGAEGVIPLTDAQQMQRLGEAIGKYIKINVDNKFAVNGRVVSRELKQIENEENFAFNGG